jgi:hypothetical protein
VLQESGEAWKEPGKNLLNLEALAEDFKVSFKLLPFMKMPLTFQEYRLGS